MTGTLAERGHFLSSAMHSVSSAGEWRWRTGRGCAIYAKDGEFVPSSSAIFDPPGSRSIVPRAF